MRERDFSHYTAYSSKRFLLLQSTNEIKKVNQKKLNINLEEGEKKKHQQGTTHHQN